MDYLAASYGEATLVRLWRIESKQICLFVGPISGYQAKLPYM